MSTKPSAQPFARRCSYGIDVVQIRIKIEKRGGSLCCSVVPSFVISLMSDEQGGAAAGGVSRTRFLGKGAESQFLFCFLGFHSYVTENDKIQAWKHVIKGTLLLTA